MGQQLHIKLSDVLRAMGDEDRVEITSEVFPADEQQGWAKKVVRTCRVSLIGHSDDYPNISFGFSMSEDCNSMCMDYNPWSDLYELKQEFVRRLNIRHIIS